MALNVTKTEMWSVTIDDRAGGAAEKMRSASGRLIGQRAGLLDTFDVYFLTSRFS
jgi:hypothetical protein